MSITVSIVESDLYTALRGFLMGALSCAVVKGQENRSAMPSGDFCVMTSLGTQDISTPTSAYTDPGTNPGGESYSQSVQWTCQLDFYGPSAFDNASIIARLMRTPYACDAIAAAGFDFQPLYASDPKNTTFANGQQQYESRWTFDFIGQFNPNVSTSQDFASSLDINLAEVDATFPPE